LVPKDPALWKLDRFEEFIAERKVLIRKQFGYLLVGGDARVEGAA
jgi:hypothetical protein